MAARWQQWMPFHIDRFRGSPDVQAMHPAARIGYLYLLAAAWQSDDCTISSDPLDLASASGLGDELWAQYGKRILKKFRSDGQGKLKNFVLDEEWKEAKRIFEARVSAAKSTNASRSPHADRTVTDGIAARSADTITGTYTETNTKAKSSRGKREAKSPSKTEIAKSRHAEFKAAIGVYWESKNPGVEMPWDGAEGRTLEIWLRSCPQTTVEDFRGYLRNRYLSDVNHTERPSRWIGNITNFAKEPLDQFGNPKSFKLRKNPVNNSNRFNHVGMM